MTHMTQIFTMDVERDINQAVEFAELLAEHCLKGEFYICGYLVERYPNECRKIAKNHTVGGHGYNHENFAELSYSKAEEIIRRTVNIFRENDMNIEGWRFPGLSFRNCQLKIIAEQGLFDSSLRDVTFRRWGRAIFIWNFLSALKRGYLFFPNFFPKGLKEKPWSVADLNDIDCYKREGRIMTHCYTYPKIKDKIKIYLKHER